MTKAIRLNGTTKYLENVLAIGDNILNAAFGDFYAGISFVIGGTTGAAQQLLWIAHRTTTSPGMGVEMFINPSNQLFIQIFDAITPVTAEFITSAITLEINRRYQGMLVRRDARFYLYLQGIVDVTDKPSVHDIDLASGSKSGWGFQVGAQNIITSPPPTRWADIWATHPFYGVGTVNDATALAIFNENIPLDVNLIAGIVTGANMDDTSIPLVPDSTPSANDWTTVNVASGDVVDFPFGSESSGIAQPVVQPLVSPLALGL